MIISTIITAIINVLDGIESGSIICGSYNTTAYHSPCRAARTVVAALSAEQRSKAMRMLMASAALSAGILAFAAGGRAEAADFNEASIQGSYSLSLNGTITFAGGKQLFLPTWSVGVMQADGAGHIVAGEFVGNLGGCVILKQAGTGTYSVNPNGTGSGEVQLTSEPVGARGVA
jgi:hypothetical protein